MYFKDLMRHISVEPVVFLYFITMMFSVNLGTNLLLYKACDPTGAITERVGSKCANETEAQHVVAPINGWKILVQQMVPILLAMVAGTWSDRNGRRRRPLIVLPIVGQVLSDSVSLYCAVQWSVSPMMTAAWQAITIAFSGGPPMLFNGVNSYVADTTTEEWRTVKFGTVGGIIALGGILGMLIYGYIVINLGFVSAYVMAVCLGLITLILAFVLIDDVVDDNGSNSGDDQSISDKLPLYQEVVRTVNPVDVLRTCYCVLTKKRPGHNTQILCIVILACAPFTCVPLEGEMSILYLFLRYKFQWNELNFSIFNVYQMIVVLFGTIFALAILSHKFRMDDALIGTIASICDLLAAIAFLLVSQSWQLYLVPPLELFRGAALSLTCSIASKCVGLDELGSMNAMKLLIESAMKSGFLPLYNFMYNHTFESMPSAFYLISIILTTPLVFCFGFIYYLNRNPKSIDHENNQENRKPTNEVLPINNCGVISYHI